MRLIPISFATSIERRTAWLFLCFCVFPIMALTGLTAYTVQSQVVDMAADHLREQAKSYGLHLVDRLEMVARNLEAGNVSGGSAPPSTGAGATPEQAAPGLPERGRRMLRRVEHGFELGVPGAEGPRWARLGDAALLATLDRGPFGVRTCIRLGGEPLGCAGPEHAGRQVESSWRLPLLSLYDSDLILDVAMSRSMEDILDEVGVSYHVLPYLVCAVMLMGGWWVLGRLKRSFAPIADLNQATQRVRAGDFSGMVDIRSGDELQSLGDAFNQMTRQLQLAFDTTHGLAEIDHMVSNGAQLAELLRRALQLMRALGLVDGAIWLWTSEGSELHELGEAGELTQRQMVLPDPAPGDLKAGLAALALNAVTVTGPATEISRDGELVGMIWCGPGGAREPEQQKVIKELGVRLSVALTLASRAHALFRQAHYDGLTGLLNREAFGERLSRATRSALRDGSRGALICLDLDRFKQVNDTEGHHVGDRLLVHIAERLRRAVRETDDVARLGGDEFAVLVASVESNSEIELVCRRIISEINRAVDLGGLVHVADASLGVAVFPDDGEDAQTLQRKADVAMYKAKEQSGCSLSFFDADMNRQTEMRAHVESRLRKGLKARELCLHFQPKVRVADGRVVGVEGLLRWPDAADLSPGVFVPVAEQTGLIHEFTRILVEDGKDCLKQCRAAGFEIDRVSVNVSPRQLLRGRFAQAFLATIFSRGADPADFEIEVTESVFVHDPELVTAELELLRGAGVTVALDDFGTGYSSLNVLRELPLDVVKIDRSFVTPIAGSAQARDFVGRIIDLVRSLSLTCVAEGVESERELALLREKDCDIVQGFLFSPALPTPELLRFLEEHQRTSLSA